MVRCAFGILLCGAAFSGCAVHETHKDHDLIRTALLDLYTNQIMDNLVRTVNGLPIIQLDYTNAATQVTITNSISGSDTQAITASNLLTIPAATLAATRTIMTTLMGNLGNMNSNQVSIAATPLTTSNEVYDAYLEFLDEEKNPGSLIVTCDPPKPGQAHLCKKFNGQYYWVPMMYRKLFFQLALSTTAQRGKPFQAPDKFYKVTLADPGRPQDNPTFPGTGWLLIFDIAGQKIPIDDGYLVLDSDKAGTKFPIQTVPAATTAGLAAPSVATQLRVIIGHDDLDLELDQAGVNEPQVGRKDLLYVSDKDNKLRFVFFDGNGQPKRYEEAGSKDNAKLRQIKALLGTLWRVRPTEDQKLDVIDLARSICSHYPNAKLGLFSQFPQTGKLLLKRHAPTIPTTEDALNRVNFQLQQIQFNQLRQPTM
ncbi:MAG: hypothetical protein ACLQIB_21380 [Isosphaeraceae bacterium]